MKNLNTFLDTDFSKSVEHYFYDGQLRKIQMVFAAIFSELQVSVGKNGREQQTQLMTVPIKIGSMDRVVAAIKAHNTQNVPLRLPAMAAQMTNLEIAYDRIKGLNQQTRKTTFPLGGTLPDGGKVVYKRMPMPYYVDMELAIMATNQQQHTEMLEQILLLFTPDLQIQTSDEFLDWTAITHVELTDIGLETPYPDDGTDRRIITTTLQFRAVAYLSPPANVKDNYIKKIAIRIGAVANGESLDDYLINDIPGAEDEYFVVADVTKMGIPPQ